MAISSDESGVRPLSPDEIARLDALKSDGMPVALAIVLIAIVVTIVTWQRHGAFWASTAALAGVAMAVLTVLGRSRANANLQADVDGGVKRLAAARVVKVVHDDEGSRFRIELLTEETPPCELVFSPPNRALFEVERGERVQVAYAPISKTIISAIALGYEYELGALDADWKALLDKDAAETQLQSRRAQRDAARELRRMASCTRVEVDPLHDLGARHPEAMTSADDVSQAVQSHTIEPLDKHDRSTLAARQVSGRGFVALLCVPVLVLAAIWALAGADDIGAGATAVMIVAALLAVAAVVFVVMNEDDKVQSDLDAGVKVGISGRISHMRAESSEGGNPYHFITVTLDQPPPQTIVFQVESRLYRALLPGDVVRVVYVTASNTILHLRTDTYSYSLHQEGS